MKIEVNIKKSYFLILVGILALGIGIFAVYAYSSSFNNPTSNALSFGHSADEVVVKMDDGRVVSVQDLLKGGLSTINVLNGEYDATSQSIQSVSTGVSSTSFPNAVAVLRGASQYDDNRDFHLNAYISQSGGNWAINVTRDDNSHIIAGTKIHYTLLYWN